WEKYAWPGNVRELRNAIARRLALGDLDPNAGEAIEDSEEASAPAAASDFMEHVLDLDLPLLAARNTVVSEFERRYVERLLAKYNGNVARAAEVSGVARRHFQRIRARRRTDG